MGEDGGFPDGMWEGDASVFYNPSDIRRRRRGPSHPPSQGALTCSSFLLSTRTGWHAAPLRTSRSGSAGGGAESPEPRRTDIAKDHWMDVYDS